VRVPRADLVSGDTVADELGVNAAFAHAPRDQLRVLPAEIENEDRPLFRRPFRQRQNLSADSSAPPS